MKSACVLAGVSEVKLYNYTIRTPLLPLSPFPQMGVSLKGLVPWPVMLRVLLQLITVVLEVSNRQHGTRKQGENGDRAAGAVKEKLSVCTEQL